MMTMDHVSDFISAACVPLDRNHASGTAERADSILAEHPEVAEASIYAAAILGDHSSVQRFLELDESAATAKGGPHSWDALTYLCFSKYLRLDDSRSDGFVSSARALLDAGASANTGWFEVTHQPKPEWESVLYGAAGVAHHPGVTRLLVERGANPNDEEVTYHPPEGYDNRALEIIVDSGRLTDDSLTTMLLRKHDWHDYDGIVFLLEHGADPNRVTRWGRTPVQHAVQRDNSLEIIEALLDHRGDMTTETNVVSGATLAARRGRGDVLRSLAGRGIQIRLDGVNALIAACATGDVETINRLAGEEPRLVATLVSEGGKLLAEFAGNGNSAGVGKLLDLGVSVAALYVAGDGYYDIAANSTALHVAAWRARHDTVKLLIERGAPIDALDGSGRTPLAKAVLACVDSYWSDRRSPESVEALLAAGASVRGVRFPSGYGEVDALLEAHMK